VDVIVVPSRREGHLGAKHNCPYVYLLFVNLQLALNALSLVMFFRVFPHIFVKLLFRTVVL
jgi:hypothetical protein